MEQKTERQSWMATLAKSSPEDLEKRVKTLGDLPEYRFLRSPEIGLTMVRGRAGGTGRVFNLGEMTIVRCTAIVEERIGFGYVGGRSRRHAELAAVCDALLQHPNWRDRVRESVIEPLQKELDGQKETQQRQTESTKVNFFTLLRGE
ncbi:MAG: phosphonate C-P lyase system protein PhnG [Cyanobacteria bacterium SBLK]|nr:phosphonate C-P lyase system protein PhnG [Cyanobacteria bacterium SBLK]